MTAEAPRMYTRNQRPLMGIGGAATKTQAEAKTATTRTPGANWYMCRNTWSQPLMADTPRR